MNLDHSHAVLASARREALKAFHASDGPEDERVIAATDAFWGVVSSSLRAINPTDLPQPPELDATTAENYARFLGERSGHNRFTGEGWRTLLRSTVDIDLAYKSAKGGCDGDPEDPLLATLAAIRRALMDHAKTASREPSDGPQPL